jgi:hypothetical protein
MGVAGDISLPRAVVVRYTLAGDSNLDGRVNAIDFNALASSFGGVTNQVWVQGDFNYDGSVSSADFSALAVNFGSSILPSAALGTLVPEPGTLGALCGLCGMAGIRRRSMR